MSRHCHTVGETYQWPDRNLKQFQHSLWSLQLDSQMMPISSTQCNPATSARLRAEAKELLDVAYEAKISDKSSIYLKTYLEDVSIDFCSYDISNNSNSLQEMDSDNDDSSTSDKYSMSAVDSIEMSLSESNGNDSHIGINQAKKDLLLKILAFHPPNSNIPTKKQQQDHSRQDLPDYQFELDNDENIAPIPLTVDNLNVLTTTANYNRTEKDLLFKIGDNDKLNSEINRLTSILDDRRSQFRDLVRN